MVFGPGRPPETETPPVIGKEEGTSCQEAVSLPGVDLFSHERRAVVPSSWRNRFFLLLMSSFLVVYVIWPLAGLYLRADWAVVAQTARDAQVLSAIWRSLWTALAATTVIAFFGTPLAYLLARHPFRGRALLEAVIDLPIMVPHTVAGIAVLMTFSPKAPLGAFLVRMGLSPVNSNFAIILACIFVSVPFYVDAARDAFAAVSPRLERVSRTLGASWGYTFFHVTLPLARRGILSGLIMSWARAISEFGAVVIMAYHPMVAPTLIYDRFATFGLRYSSPVAVQLVSVCLLLFVLLRLLASGEAREGGARD